MFARGGRVRDTKRPCAKHIKTKEGSPCELKKVCVPPPACMLVCMRGAGGEEEEERSCIRERKEGGEAVLLGVFFFSSSPVAHDPEAGVDELVSLLPFSFFCLHPLTSYVCACGAGGGGWMGGRAASPRGEEGDSATASAPSTRTRRGGRAICAGFPRSRLNARTNTCGGVLGDCHSLHSSPSVRVPLSLLGGVSLERRERPSLPRHPPSRAKMCRTTASLSSTTPAAFFRRDFCA